MRPPVSVNAPASKSLSHRALMAAALARGESVVENLLVSQDTERTVSCLAACGAAFKNEDRRVQVRGIPEERKAPDQVVDLDMGESGTSCRLLTAVAAAVGGRFRVFGRGRLHQRPVGELARALEGLGVGFVWEGEPNFPPFIMESRGFEAGQVDISLEESSQYLSGLLMASCLAKGPVTVSVVGQKAVSWPYVALTLKTMEDFKIAFRAEVLEREAWVQVPWRSIRAVEPGRLRFVVLPGRPSACAYRVEGDWSNGSYFLAAGAVGPAPVTVKGLAVGSLQGDRAILDILTRMGAGAKWDEQGVAVMPGKLSGQELTMGRCPDLVPTVAVVAAFADGPTTIRNVAHLRIKESDRLEVLAAEIAKTGCRTALLDDGIVIEPAPLPAGRRIDFATRGDHRMAMSLALFGLAGIDARLDDPGCVAKSFPDFWDEWAKVRAGGGQ
ncbi:MAG: 3-phosphoshikimate 1-carboxyvinyltransferase [Desulfovibrionaceae bacterium]|nr:3-phosphoshikimate 1-carboxyvinyltransferase [Desulfovibrionaceae bacterium]